MFASVLRRGGGGGAKGVLWVVLSVNDPSRILSDSQSDIQPVGRKVPHSDTPTYLKAS